MKKIIGLLSVIILGFTACNVTELEEPQIKDSNGNIVSGSIQGGDIVATDSTLFIQTISTDSSRSWKTLDFTLAGSRRLTNCRLDDIMKFNNDGSYEYSAGGELCGAEDNRRSRNGRWEIDYSRKLMFFDKGSSNEYQAKVIGLENNELTLQGSYMGMEVLAKYSFIQQ